MSSFAELSKQLNFKPLEQKTFMGDSITKNKVLNCPISIIDYDIGPSKYEQDKGQLCLTLSILFKGELRIFWTSSKYLINDIKQIPKNEFPFTTTIVQKDDNRMLFE